MNKTFFDAIRPIFGGKLEQDHVDGINTILSAWDTWGDGDDNKLAYILATAKWETAHTMQPVAEAYWVKNAEAWRKKNLRYYPYYGRGFVQLTWHRNYQDWSSRTGLDLVSKPELAMIPAVAARILVQGCMIGTFTGKGLGDYITADKADFKSARRVVNGTDKASQIATIATQFASALEQGRAVALKPESVAPPPPDVEPPLPTDPGTEGEPGTVGQKAIAGIAVAVIIALLGWLGFGG